MFELTSENELYNRVLFMNIYCICELLSVWTAPCKDLGYDEPEHATCDRDRGLWQGCELLVLLQTGKTCCIDQYWSVLITGNSVQLYRQNPTTILVEKLSILITDTGEYFCVSFYMNGIPRKWVKGDNIYNIYSIFKRSFMQINLYASLLRLKYDSS